MPLVVSKTPTPKTQEVDSGEVPTGRRCRQAREAGAASTSEYVACLSLVVEYAYAPESLSRTSATCLASCVNASLFSSQYGWHGWAYSRMEWHYGGAEGQTRSQTARKRDRVSVLVGHWVQEAKDSA